MDNEGHIQKEFDRLIGRHRKFIEFLCRRAAYGREHRASDLMQECYAALFNRLQERKQEMSEPHERVWVYWQCRGAITSYQRKERRFSRIIQNGDVPDILTVTHEVTRLTVDELSNSLTPTERCYFVFMVEGVSDEEIARRMEVQPHTVVQMRNKIKRKIMEYIKQ